MDDGWGNIAYLVLIALFAIVSALKKKKPTVVVHPPDDGEVLQQTTSEPSTGLESILESFLGNEIPKPYVKPVEEVIPEREETMMEEYARLQKMKAEARGEKEKEKPVLLGLKSIYSDIDDQDKLLEDSEEQIDWRQAIIYKEILDRKYN